MVVPVIPSSTKNKVSVYPSINEQIQKGHKDALQERIEGSKGKMEAKPQVKKK